MFLWLDFPHFQGRGARRRAGNQSQWMLTSVCLYTYAEAWCGNTHTYLHRGVHARVHIHIAHMCTHTGVYAWTGTHSNTSTGKHACCLITHTHMSTQVHTCTHIAIKAHTCPQTHTCPCAHLHLHTLNLCTWGFRLHSSHSHGPVVYSNQILLL